MKTTTIEESMTDGLWSILDARAPLTAAHSVRVQGYSQLVGKALSVTADEYEILSHAALLHDYGKMGIPEVILWRTGTLSPEEDACSYEVRTRSPTAPRLGRVQRMDLEANDGTVQQQFRFSTRPIAKGNIPDGLP